MQAGGIKEQAGRGSLWVAAWVKDAFSCGAMLNFPQSVNRKRADLVMAK